MQRIEPFYAAVGRQVRAFRLRAGLSQDGLGAKLQPPMSRASITNIETGKQRILAHTLVEIARVLSVSVSDIIEPSPSVVPRRGRGAKGDAPVDASMLVREMAQQLGVNQRKARALAVELGLAEQGAS